MPEDLGKAFWDSRYRSSAAHPGRRPDPQLVAGIQDLAPGTALDVGCGEGAEAIWLAAGGWRVTAVDIAPTALRRARRHAAGLGVPVAERIEWVEADLTAWTPPEDRFDLVCAFYVHPAGSWQALVGRLAAAVVPGGTLLIVGHHPTDPHATTHPEAAGLSFAAEEVSAGLDPDRWDTRVVGVRARRAPAHDGTGAGTALVDSVLSARKRP